MQDQLEKFLRKEIEKNNPKGQFKKIMMTTIFDIMEEINQNIKYRAY